jgi:hypothetical protein
MRYAVSIIAAMRLIGACRERPYHEYQLVGLYEEEQRIAFFKLKTFLI